MVSSSIDAKPRLTTSLPGHWPVVSFGDEQLFTVGTGGTPSTERPEYYGGHVNWLKSGDVQGLYISDVPQTISTLGMENSNARVYPTGTIVLAMSGRGKTRGTSAVLAVPSACSQSVAAIVPQTSEVVSEFVHFNLAYRYDELRNLTGDADRSGLNLAIIRQIKLPLPPAPEQRAIAHALSSVQQAIQMRRREIGLERERKAALMERLFTKGTRGEPTKQTAIGEMPESWQVARIGDLVTRTQYGLSMRGKMAGQYPILRMNNLVRGRVTYTDLQHVDLDRETFGKYALQPGDVLFNRTNSYELVGKTAIFESDQPFVFASYLVRATVNRDHLLPLYLNLFLNWTSTQHRLRMLASRGASQSNINASKLRDFALALPSTAEQVEIARVLQAIDSKISAEERETVLLQELFHALLEELMTGQLSSLPLGETMEHSVDKSRGMQP